MNRLNKYVVFYEIEDVVALLNLMNERLLIIDYKLFEILRSYDVEIDRLQFIHPEFYAALLKDGMIVKYDVDETLEIINSWKSEDSNQSEIKLTINPTLQCNLRCWYCYEDHSGSSLMSQETVDAVKLMIGRLLSSEATEKLVLDFFGGEPLLYFKEVVAPLINHAHDCSKVSSKKLVISFTTNGVLLSEEICNSLERLHIPVVLQITIDGNREFHNRTRAIGGSKPTFDIIINNIKRAISKGFEVLVRLNFTHENYLGFREIIPLFTDIPDEYRKGLSFDFHKVWQENDDKHIEDAVSSINEDFIRNGFHSRADIPGFTVQRCYADKEQNIVINHDGLIYKCTARDFSKNNAEGLICIDGTILWNDRAELRRKFKFGSNVCRECTIFPLCHGGCSQEKLEAINYDKCPRGYTEQRKKELVDKKILNILKYRSLKRNDS